MGGVLTDWQKAVNTIAHALNKAGYDGDSPESKALELLAGRCEGTADAKEIAREAIEAYSEWITNFNDRQSVAQRDPYCPTAVEYLPDRIAPLLRPSVDIGKLADDFKRKYEVYKGFSPEEAERNESSSYSPSVDELAGFFSSYLTDSAGEIERLRVLLRECTDILALSDGDGYRAENIKAIEGGWNTAWPEGTCGENNCPCESIQTRLPGGALQGRCDTCR